MCRRQLQSHGNSGGRAPELGSNHLLWIIRGEDPSAKLFEDFRIFTVSLDRACAKRQRYANRSRRRDHRQTATKCACSTKADGRVITLGFAVLVRSLRYVKPSRQPGNRRQDVPGPGGHCTGHRSHHPTESF